MTLPSLESRCGHCFLMRFCSARCWAYSLARRRRHGPARPRPRCPSRRRRSATGRRRGWSRPRRRRGGRPRARPGRWCGRRALGVGDECLGATAGTAQDPERDRVAARLGREVTPEPQRGSPLPQQPVRPLVQRNVDLRVRPGTLRQSRELGGDLLDPAQVRVQPVGVDGVSGRLRGVLREVAGDLLGGEGLLRVVGAVPGADRAGVDLGPERQHPWHVVVEDRWCGEPDGGCGLPRRGRRQGRL